MDILHPEPKKPMSERMMAKLAASRFLTFSALIHVVIIFLGGSVVLFKQMADPPDFAAAEGGLVATDAQVQAPPEQPPDPTQTFTPVTPQLNAPTLSAISTTNLSTPTFQVAAAVPVVKPVTSDAMNKAMEKAATSMAKGIAAGLPATMGGRAGGSARTQMMMKTGGKKESEEAVLRGLRWLVKNQNEDGSWSKERRPAMTGFALLSFLGHGETPVSAEFGPAVGKGIEWLLQEGPKFQGRLSMTKNGWGEGHSVYEHAICTYALGEYYTMTKDERVVDLLKQAIGYIVTGQGPDGGWMYSFDKSQSDTSVSGWMVQALKAAHLTGLNIEGVDPALDKAMLNFKRVQGANGSFGYKTPGVGNGGHQTLDGVGVLCMLFWKQDKDKGIREGMEHLMKMTDEKWPVEYKGDKADLYVWYYNTQACLMYGGASWTKWNKMFQDQLIKNQSPDGSWPPVAGAAPGGDLQRLPAGVGPFLRTNLCILMLEVYYRYSPTMK